MILATAAVWGVCAVTTAGVIVRPFRWPEAVWAMLGAAALVVAGLVPWHAAVAAAARGGDVYLFLTGMMLLSETAQRQGLFDWVAAAAVARARGSTPRLFALVYAAGVAITVFLSNDATAVVLTPAVYAAARRAEADPLPLLFACALVANAASFVLPISNPANLVLYGGTPPPLGAWLAAFAWPSLASILVTFAMLRWAERRRIAGRCADPADRAALPAGGRAALAGIAATALVLLAASAIGADLGLPTAAAGIATTLIVCAIGRDRPLAVVRGVAWGVLPLVAGLFVLVEALARTGAIAAVAAALGRLSADPLAGGAVAGTVLALAANLVNNLPAGLIASSAVTLAEPPRLVVDALLIGVDLGPNLSVTGSLATILWLQAIRREGGDIGFLRFLRVGAVTMIPALVAALGLRLAAG
ncbi:MAG: arsenic transporter [Sphingomonas fennica]